MLWKVSNPMDERLKFVSRALDGERMTEFCQEFGICAGSGCLNSFPRMISGVPPGFVRSRAPGVGCDAGRA